MKDIVVRLIIDITLNYKIFDYIAKADIKLIGSEIMDSTANCNGYTNDDCTGLYGGEAFCKNTSCYCNRQSSFVNGETCGIPSNEEFLFL
jgi:hypothetical protein